VQLTEIWAYSGWPEAFMSHRCTEGMPTGFMAAP
jgi:hypothetical protein